MKKIEDLITKAEKALEGVPGPSKAHEALDAAKRWVEGTATSSEVEAAAHNAATFAASNVNYYYHEYAACAHTAYAMLYPDHAELAAFHAACA